MSDDYMMAHLTPAQRELAELWLGEQALTENADGTAYAAPANAQEQILTDIWQEVLEREPIGIDDDYFRLGGDSIAAIVVIAKARAAGLDVSTHDLLGLRTVRKIVDAIAADRAAESAASAASATVDSRLTPMQEGMLFDAAPYVVQVSARLDGDIVADDLIAAWNAVLNLHRALRISVRSDGLRPRRLVHSGVTVPVQTHDLRSLAVDEQEQAVASFLARDRERGFDVGVPPLLRLGVLMLADRSCRLVLTHHHLLLDGWSQQIVLREFIGLYDRRHVTAADVVLPIVRDAEWDLRFWRERMAGFTPGKTVPSRASAATDYVTNVDTVPDDLARDLAAFARKAGITVPTLLYAGWALLVAGISGRQDIAFGVTVSGRSAEAPGAAEAVGMFINTLPLRVKVDRREPIIAWLSRLHRDHTDLLRVQHSPLAEIARCLPVPGPARDLFDTIVVVENFPQPIRDGHESLRLRIRDVTTHIVEGYPMVLEANTALPMRLALRLDSVDGGALLARLMKYLRRLCDTSDELTTVGDLVDAMARDLRSARRQPIERST